MADKGCKWNPAADIQVHLEMFVGLIPPLLSKEVRETDDRMVILWFNVRSVLWCVSVRHGRCPGETYRCLSRESANSSSPMTLGVMLVASELKRKC
jgi:hypothetical protein